MRSVAKGYWASIFLIFTCATLLIACASAPRVIAISPVFDSVRPAVNRSTDYPEALAAIASVMASDLNLPVVEASVTFYPSQVSYEGGAVAESERDLEPLRKQLGARAELLKEEDVVFAARRSAVSSVAVGLHRRVLVNEWQFAKLPWWERMRLLAHELTHTVQRAWVEGRLTDWDRWLSEGFAEWVGYQVLDRLGAQTLAKSRQGSVEAVKARVDQTFPTLTQLVTGEEWITWLRTLGHAATYGQAFLAVDLLVEYKGLPAVVQYFRLFEEPNNRERNFATAFGEPVTKFEDKFTAHLRTLFAR